MLRPMGRICQSANWPANHLNMYGKVTYGQMIGRQLADWHIRPIGHNIYNISYVRA